MSAKRRNVAIVGVGAAYAACGAGPIMGVLATIGVGATTGVALFGIMGVSSASQPLRS